MGERVEYSRHRGGVTADTQKRCVLVLAIGNLKKLARRNEPFNSATFPPRRSYQQYPGLPSRSKPDEGTDIRAHA